MDGQDGHGLTRVPSYSEQAKVGKVDGFAVPKVTRAGSSLRVDAGTGFAHPAIAAALAEVDARWRASRAWRAAGIFASHHCGQAGRHVERLAEAGLVGFAFTPTRPAPWRFMGATRPRMGTDPLAFAAPILGRAPLVIDMALSVVARGKIVSAKAKGEAIPENWAVDAAGNSTTDPDKALAGTLLPIGGAKGSALGLMVDILCGALAGAHFSWEASAFLDAKGPPPKLGQFLIALDPAHFAGKHFAARMGELAAADGGRWRQAARRPAIGTARSRRQGRAYHRRCALRADQGAGGRRLKGLGSPRHGCVIRPANSHSRSRSKGLRRISTSPPRRSPGGGSSA